MAVPLDGSDHFSMPRIRQLVLKGNHHASFWADVVPCVDQRSAQQVLSSHTRLFTNNYLIIDKSVPKLTPMNFKMRYRIGNSSGLCPAIHRRAKSCVSLERSLQWMPPTGLTVTLYQKLTLQSTLAYLSINTHRGLHMFNKQQKKPKHFLLHNLRRAPTAMKK